MRKYELEKMLPEKFITAMKNCEQNNPHHFGTVFEHTKAALDHYVQTASEVQDWMCYAIALHDIGKPSTKTTDEASVDHFYKHSVESVKLASEFIHETFTEDDAQKILVLIKMHERQLPKDKKSFKKFQSQLDDGPLRWMDFADMREADIYGQVPSEEKITELNEFEENAQVWISEIVAENYKNHMRKRMPVTAQDLMSIGIPQNKLSETLDKCLTNYIDNICYWDTLEADDLYIKKKLIEML